MPESASNRAGHRSMVFAVILLVTSSVLPAFPPVAPALGLRTLDAGVLNNTSVSVFEAHLDKALAFTNTTLDLPLHWGATVINGTISLRGDQDLAFANLTGWGVPARSGERFGAGLGTGDFNGDGFQDLVVTADAQCTPAQEPSRIDVFFGSASGLSAAPGWSWTAPGTKRTGMALTAGDYNGDGVDDLVVGGFPYFGIPGCWLGDDETVRVFYSSPSGLPGVEDLALKITDNASMYSSFGSSVAGGVDLDNDSYDDLIIGESGNGTYGGVYTYGSAIGAVHVLWGGPAGLSMSNRTLVEGTAQHSWSNRDRLGEAVVALGDTDGDGLAEFAAGAPGYVRPNPNTDEQGRVWVFERAAGTRNFTLVFNYTGDGSYYYRFYSIGATLAGGHDVTGDGLPDLVVGAPGFFARTLVFSGKGDGTYALPPTVLGNQSFPFESPCTGESIAVVNLDGSGPYEVICGAPGTYSNFGTLFIFYGGRLDREHMVEIPERWRVSSEHFGSPVLAAGDIDGDGREEFALSTLGGKNGTVASGTVWLYFGAPHLLPQSVSVTVGDTPVFAEPADFGRLVNITGIEGALSAYLAAHRAEANNTTNLLNVPVSFNFSGGGLLNITRVSVNYTVVLPTFNVRVTAPPAGDALTIEWDHQSPDVTQYRVFSNKSGPWAQIALVGFSARSFNDTVVTNGVTYWYYVTETDTALGLTSAPSAIVSGVPRDAIPPTGPRNLSVTVAVGDRSATIRWSASSDDTVGYEVWRADGGAAAPARVATVSAPGASYVDTGLMEEVDYAYTVRAVDEAGLASDFTAAVSARVPDVVPPPAPAGLSGAPLPSGTELLVRWTPNARDTVRYAVYVSPPNSSAIFTLAGETPGSNFTLGGLARDTRYYVRVRAVDAVGQLSPESTTVSLFTHDSLAPGAPVLESAAPAPEGGAVDLSWGAAGDDLSGFAIYVDTGAGWARSLTVEAGARGAQVVGLQDGVPAAFRVTAIDGGQLESAPSNVLSATPGDSEPPGQVTGVSVTSAEGGSALEVVWAAVADSDVAGYRIYLLDPNGVAEFVRVADVSAPATSYPVDGLEDGLTYRIRVTAVDEIPNESPPSADATGTPRDRMVPARPVFFDLPPAANAAPLTVSGRAEAGTTVEVYKGASPVATFLVGPTGSFSGALPLAAGINTFTAKAVDGRNTTEESYRSSAAFGPFSIRFDPDAPTVRSATPAEGETGVSVSSNVRIEFSEVVDPESVVVEVLDAAGQPIAGTLVVLEGGTTATFTPVPSFAPGTGYTVKVRALDEAGNPMDEFTFTFSTASGGGLLPGAGAFVVALAMGAAATADRVRRSREGRQRVAGEGPSGTSGEVEP